MINEIQEYNEYMTLKYETGKYGRLRDGVLIGAGQKRALQIIARANLFHSMDNGVPGGVIEEFPSQQRIQAAIEALKRWYNGNDSVYGRYLSAVSETLNKTAEHPELNIGDESSVGTFLINNNQFNAQTIIAQALQDGPLSNMNAVFIPFSCIERLNASLWNCREKYNNFPDAARQLLYLLGYYIFRNGECVSDERFGEVRQMGSSYPFMYINMRDFNNWMNTMNKVPSKNENKVYLASLFKSLNTAKGDLLFEKITQDNAVFVRPSKKLAEGVLIGRETNRQCSYIDDVNKYVVLLDKGYISRSVTSKEVWNRLKTWLKKSKK